MNRYSTRQVGVPCVLYTAHARISGEAESHYHFLLDLLNAEEQDVMLVRNAVIRPLIPGGTDELRSSSVLLRKDHIILGAIDPAGADGEVAQAVQGKPVIRPATLEAGPFIIQASIPLPTASQLSELLLHGAHNYLAATVANVVHQTAAFACFAAPYLVINRRWIDALIEEPEVISAGEQESAPAPAAAPVVAGGPRAGAFTGSETAEVLFATEVFGGTDLATLEAIATPLATSGGAVREEHAAGTAVVREGEPGDVLYVVASGTLEVRARDRLSGLPRALATLSTGDVFGEMALLGDGRRTATVRAVSDAVLLKLSADAWNVLAAQLPAATANLIRMMTLRRAPRGGLLRRSL